MIAGIPQTLSFYTYYPLWKTFPEGLGAQVVLSRPTNREILEWGLRDTKIALLGYLYVLYDPFLSANLYRRLVGMGADPLTPEQLSALQLRRANKELPQHFFWYYSNRVVLSSLYYLEKPGRVPGGETETNSFECKGCPNIC